MTRKTHKYMQRHRPHRRTTTNLTAGMFSKCEHDSTNAHTIEHTSNTWHAGHTNTCEHTHTHRKAEQQQQIEKQESTENVNMKAHAGRTRINIETEDTHVRKRTMKTHRHAEHIRSKRRHTKQNRQAGKHRNTKHALPLDECVHD